MSRGPQMQLFKLYNICHGFILHRYLTLLSVQHTRWPGCCREILLHIQTIVVLAYCISILLYKL